MFFFVAKKAHNKNIFEKVGKQMAIHTRQKGNKQKMRLNISGYCWLLLLICGLKTISLCLACSEWTKKKTHFSIWSFGKRLQLVTGQLKIISWFIVRNNLSINNLSWVFIIARWQKAKRKTNNRHQFQIAEKTRTHAQSTEKQYHFP